MKKMYLVMIAQGKLSITLFRIPLTQLQVDSVDIFYSRRKPDLKIQGPGLLIDYNGLLWNYLEKLHEMLSKPLDV